MESKVNNYSKKMQIINAGEGFEEILVNIFRGDAGEKGAFFTGRSLCVESQYGDGAGRNGSALDGHSAGHIEILQRQGAGLNSH